MNGISTISAHGLGRQATHMGVPLHLLTALCCFTVAVETCKLKRWTNQPGNSVSKYVFRNLLNRSCSPGTFVEFGCADGTSNSQTYPFERFLGWRGLCIEPNVPNYRVATSRRAITENALITGTPGVFTYAEGHLGGPCEQASGIVEFYSPAFLDILKKCDSSNPPSVTRRTVPGVSLESLLEKHGFDSVDWISVDCEGCEGSFISNFNFTKYKVRIVSYEPNTAARLHTREIEAALSRHGFVFKVELQDRVWYKHKL